MKCLLDTHALIWWLNDDKQLSSVARDLIADRQNLIYVSAASAWEIAIKHQKGKLPTASLLLPDFSSVIAEVGFLDLSITSAHMVRSSWLPGGHKDPFDRILAAQAIMEDMTLISIDRKMASLSVQTRCQKLKCISLRFSRQSCQLPKRKTAPLAERRLPNLKPSNLSHNGR